MRVRSRALSKYLSQSPAGLKRISRYARVEPGISSKTLNDIGGKAGNQQTNTLAKSMCHTAQLSIQNHVIMYLPLRITQEMCSIFTEGKAIP